MMRWLILEVIFARPRGKLTFFCDIFVDRLPIFSKLCWCLLIHFWSGKLDHRKLLLYREISHSFQGCFSVMDQTDISASMCPHLCSLWCCGSLSRSLPLSIWSFCFEKVSSLSMKLSAKNVSFPLGLAKITSKIDFITDLMNVFNQMMWLVITRVPVAWWILQWGKGIRSGVSGVSSVRNHVKATS